MIKSKKSRGEIAGQFRKMAAAATIISAFKPRPGGAAERLARQNQTKSNDGIPDGITGVVPAPPRPISAQKPPPEPTPPALTPELQLRPKTADRRSGSGIPEVKVTVPKPNSRPNSLQASLNDKKASEDAAEEEERRMIVAGNDSKYFATLAMDPSILNTKTAEFAKWLDYFGWVPGDQMRARHFDELRIDVDRELNKAQAGGWLARFQEEDERVEAIKKGVDMAIDECDELDNLLTLYSVELSVSSLLSSIRGFWLTNCRLSRTISRILKRRGRVYRFKLPIRNCSRRNWRVYCRLARLARMISRLFNWRRLRRPPWAQIFGARSHAGYIHTLGGRQDVVARRRDLLGARARMPRPKDRVW